MHPFIEHFLKAREQLGNNTSTAKILHLMLDNNKELNFDIPENARYYLECLPPALAQNLLVHAYKQELTIESNIPQFCSLPTGSYLHCKNIISIEEINQLIAICDHYFLSNKAPLQLKDAFQDPRSTIWEGKPWLKKAITSVAKMLSKEGLFNNGIAIIQARCLLRRTYPINHFSSEKPYGNNNNQNWHQDSNARMNNRRMVTIWIPLQPGAGNTCPGISICNAQPDRFNTWLGDGCCWEDLTSKYNEFTLTETTPIVSQGDAVIFDGLTYHQTYTNIQMEQHRDALLLRFTEPQFIQHFPNADPLIIAY